MMSQPSEEDRANARSQALLSLGLGMMAGSTGPRGANSLGQIVGRAGLNSMDDYNQSLMMAQRQKQQEFQSGLALQKIMEDQRAKKLRQDQLTSLRSTLPEADRQLFDVAPDEYIKNMPRFQKPQLVDVADPKEPLRVQKVWMRPGETQGTVAGVGTMPEILDSRVQVAKQKIAAAGAARQSINLPPMESEEQKAVGKDLAEQYSTLQKAGLGASGVLNNVKRAEQLMAGLTTGKLAPAKAEVAAVAESLGVKLDPKLDQKQAFVALTNEIALRNKNKGGENLMPGAMSEGDRTFLQQMGPSLANTPGGNTLIFETAKRTAQRDIEVARMAREYRQKHKTLNGFAEELSAWSEKNPLFSDMQQPSGGFKIIGVR